MKLVRQFVALLWSSARWQLLWAVLLSTLLSLTEGVSLAMIFPLVTLLGNPSAANSSGTAGSANPGPHTQWAFHLLAATHLPRGAWLPALLLAAVGILGLLAQWNGVFSTLSIAIIMRVRVRLADELYRAILHADWTFLTRRRSSDLTHLLTDELNRAGSLASSLVALVSNGMVSLLMLGVAVVLAPQLTLIVALCFALLVPLQRRSSRAIHDDGERQSLRLREVFSSSMERIQNLKVVKAYGAQDLELALFSQRYGAAADGLMQSEWRRNLASRRFQILSLALLCGLILFGLGVLHLGPETILLFLFAFTRASPRLGLVQSKVNDILSDLPAYRHIADFVAECDAHSERIEEAAPPPRLTHSLRLEQVTFAYAPGSRTILHQLSLDLPAGSITALAGFSGAGKSTVADLILGLLLPGSGQVTVDGRPLTRENARAWRRKVGYVSQDTLLFHASVRENLLWARPDASDQDLLDALAAARADFVQTLAQGMETVVGDRGMMLSHGQRQRIALARAFLLKPELLILDEATNSLDLENEESILRSVQMQGQSLFQSQVHSQGQPEGKGLTTLLISHRPSALKTADLIYVLKDGAIHASGTWPQVRAVIETELLDRE